MNEIKERWGEDSTIWIKTGSSQMQGQGTNTDINNHQSVLGDKKECNSRKILTLVSHCCPYNSVKQYTFSRKHTSKWGFGSFPGPATCRTIRSREQRYSSQSAT